MFTRGYHLSPTFHLAAPQSPWTQCYQSAGPAALRSSQGPARCATCDNDGILKAGDRGAYHYGILWLVLTYNFYNLYNLYIPV